MSWVSRYKYRREQKRKIREMADRTNQPYKVVWDGQKLPKILGETSIREIVRDELAKQQHQSDENIRKYVTPFMRTHDPARESLSTGLPEEDVSDG